MQSVYGPYLRDTPGDRTFDLCITGYGPLVAGVIEKRASPFLFVDIGANCGVFSLLAARHPWCVSVTAIEPVPATFDALTSNIAFNRAENMSAVRGLVSLRSGETLHLTYNPRHSGMSAITSEENENPIAAPVLDASALSGLIGIPECSVLVKIDVEGSEPDVLKVLRECSFFTAVTDIVIEISERNGGAKNVRETLDILEAAGFGEVGRDGLPEHYDAHYVRSGR